MTIQATLPDGSIPDWYREIFPAAQGQGFFLRTGPLRMLFVARSMERAVVTIEARTSHRGSTEFSHPALEAACRASNWSHVSLQLGVDALDAGMSEDDIHLIETRLTRALSDAKEISILTTEETTDFALALSRGANARVVSVFPKDLRSDGAIDLALGGAGIATSRDIDDSEKLLAAFAPESPLANLLETVLFGAVDEDAIEAQLAAFEGPAPTEAATLNTPPRPHLPGNAWMLENHENGIRYMSDRWAGRTIGFVERDRTTLAETPKETVAMVAIGDWAGLARPVQERYPWHVVDASLDGYAANMQARNHGIDHVIRREARGYGMQSVTAIDLPCAGSVAADFAENSPYYARLTEDLTEMSERRATFDQSVHVERLCLGLLAGAPQIGVEDAKHVYRDVITRCLSQIHKATGQQSRPIIVVTQAAGTRTEGRADPILAEGQLEQELPASTFTIAGPAYPYALMADMPATPTPDARLLMDEVECCAVDAKQRGDRWFCPTLRFATQNGVEIIAEFTTLLPLSLDEAASKAGRHGFRLEGCSNNAEIETVEVIAADKVRILCNKAPHGASLAYAWGFQSEGSKNQTANHGALRDSWQTESRSVPGQMLYRYALAGCVEIQPVQIQRWQPGGRR